VREALSGTTVTGEALPARRASELRREPLDSARDARRERKDLTHRERAALRCVAQGQSNKLIARTLSITEGTVKVHVGHLLKKLGFRSRIEAAVWATENGPKR